MSAFSGILSALRREAGYPTAYGFYHRNGGRGHFGCTYVHYMRLERGARAPQPGALRAMLQALRLPPSDRDARRLFKAYLLDVLGGAENFELIVGALAAPARGPSGPRKLRAGSVVHLSQAQFATLAFDETTYWTSELLLNDRKSWTARQVAARLECPEPAAATALERLRKARLVRATSKNRYRTRRPGCSYTFPGRTNGMGPLLRRVRGWWTAASRRRGSAFGDRVELVRASSTKMRRYLAALYRAVDEAGFASTHDPGEDTALFAVEARVRRLMAF